MSSLVKILIIAIFGLVIFGQGLFKSRIVYWAMYIVMFALIPLLWETMYWVSKKKMLSVLDSNKVDYDVFVGKVPQNPQDDLQRGRLCFTDGSIKLVSRTGRSVQVVWECNTKEIKSIGFGTVAGIRKGFTLYLEEGEVSFTSAKLFKNRNELYSALGWDIN